MDLVIRNVEQQDLETITQIESICFPFAEAADSQTIAKRIKVFGDHFYVAEVQGEVVGFINGCVTDTEKITDLMFQDTSLHNPTGDYQSIFGLDVHPDHQGKGIAKSLMRHMIANAIRQKRKGLILTCKDSLISYYEMFGYSNRGCSQSVHGGAV